MKKILFLLLLSNLAFAQAPVLESKPLTVIFKDVTQHDLLKLTVETLKKSQQVEPLVMRRAQRGFVEYEGLYSGDQEALLGVLNSAVGDKLSVQAHPAPSEGLEILVTGMTY